MKKEEVLEFVQSCQQTCGGLSASVGHDPHILYTLSGVQVCIFPWEIVSYSLYYYKTWFIVLNKLKTIYETELTPLEKVK